jgi:predicted DCC family thiol-disulfide oxidoreductase YuxK
VRFVARHDSAARFRFAGLSSPAAARLLAAAGTRRDVLPSSVVLVDGGRVLVESDAALAITARLDAPWRRLALLRAVPRPLRDGVYRVVARVRHRLSGRRACQPPPPWLRERFLDAAR